MTAPRAVGVRIGYAAVPAAVRAWVDEALGSPVVATLEQESPVAPDGEQLSDLGAHGG